MKRLFSMLLLAAAICLFAACTPQSSPRQLAKTFWTDVQQEKYSEAVSLYYNIDEFISEDGKEALVSQFDYIYNMKRVKPILLLDDIFDKLDESRISQLLNLVGNEHFGQVFLSDTDEDRIVRILNRHGISHKIFRVEKE